MRSRLVMAGLMALSVYPATSLARLWVGGDLGLTGGALTGTSPIGVYAGLSTRSFPLGVEVGYQALSANPGKIGMFTATALYRTPITQVRGMYFLARGGIATIYSDPSVNIRSTTRPLIGAGVSYRLARNVNLRAEYDLIVDPRTTYGPSQNADELLAGVSYQFGGMR
ncbi:MAG: outer membrane beta-barrel protein [Acidiferrobacter sp.]